MEKQYESFVDALIELAIAEDIGDGDHSSLSTIPHDELGRMQLLVKQEGIIAGIEIAKRVFSRLDPEVKFEQILQDGDKIKVGDIAFFVSGKLITLLQSERIILNIMQRMSGVATQTAFYVEQLKGLKTRLLDTRKTTPGMRVMDKMAVKIGGGENHRMGLFDMVMLKDNHIDFAGGITAALSSTRSYLKEKGKDLKIEVEVRSIADIHEVFAAGGADRIMLDNFSLEDTKTALKIIGDKAWTELSGGVKLDTLKLLGQLGADFISTAASVHSSSWIDIGLDS